MKFPCVSVALFSLLLTGGFAFAGDQSPPAPAHMSRQTRLDLIRAFNSELVYIRTPFPMGKTGLTLKTSGDLYPSGPELQQMIAMWGPSVKPGDRARISGIVIKDNQIHFEINGGPVKNSKWYQRVTVGGVTGNNVPIAPSDAQANARGSYVDLVFPHYVPELGPIQLKALLHPVFDFDSKSALEAYLDTVPPKAKLAIQNHQVLVGMNHEMVICAKGRAPKKDREKDGDTEWEEWIFGEPPEDVDFVRFVGDEVVRVETIKVSGEKIVRADKEIELQPPTEVAKKDAQSARPTIVPTLRRPGEETPNNAPTATPSAGRAPLPPPPPPGIGDGPGNSTGPPPTKIPAPNFVAVNR
jgi:hypothetical protein